MRKINITKCKHVENSSFDTIIYRKRGSGTLLVELPYNGKVFEMPAVKISEYIHEIKSKTDWVPVWDNELIKIEDETVYQYKFITKNVQRFYLNFTLLSHQALATDQESIEKINQFNNNDDFRIRIDKKFKDEMNRVTHHRFKIDAALPVLPLGVLVVTNTVTHRNRIARIFCKYNNQHYQFPYGNVRSSMTPCLAEMSASVKSSDQFFYQFITTSFNQDLGVHLKYNENAGRITFDKDYVENEIEKDDVEKRNLNLIDLLYYLSKLSIEEFLEKDLDKIFLKPIKDPKRGSDTNGLGIE